MALALFVLAGRWQDPEAADAAVPARSQRVSWMPNLAVAAGFAALLAAEISGTPAVAVTIVTERHGGSIGFTSKPGQGATFEVRLPV